MNSYKFSVIVPVIYLTKYSRKAIQDIFTKIDSFPHILFIFSCTESVVGELNAISLKHGAKENTIIAPSKAVDSNNLRHNGIKHAKTNYVFYQDCDDEVDYQVVLDNFSHCTGDNIVCFNIRRRLFDIDGNVIDDRLLYPNKNYEIKNISSLMTNIVNKLIPKKMLEKVCFYNIPFSQDQSISFQLFERCPHWYCSRSAYLYENNCKSTAGLNKTKRESLLRVVAIERILMKILLNKSNRAYVKYRYQLLIQGRFAYLNECYFPSFSLGAINPLRFGLRGSINHLYHYSMAYISCGRILICKYLKRRN